MFSNGTKTIPKTVRQYNHQITFKPAHLEGAGLKIWLQLFRHHNKAWPPQTHTNTDVSGVSMLARQIIAGR